MTLERERNPVDYLDRGEEAPSAQQTRLAGREAHVLKGQQAVVGNAKRWIIVSREINCIAESAGAMERCASGRSDWDAATRRLFASTFGERRHVLFEFTRYFFGRSRGID